jgi:hypothetical protein
MPTWVDVDRRPLQTDVAHRARGARRLGGRDLLLAERALLDHGEEELRVLADKFVAASTRWSIGQMPASSSLPSITHRLPIRLVRTATTTSALQ